MDTLMTILKIAVIVGCGVGLFYLAIYSRVFWGMAEAVCKAIEYIIKFITIPIKILCDKVKNKVSLPSFSFKEDAISRFARYHPTLGTERSIKFFIVAFIYLVIVFTIKLLNGSFGDYLRELIHIYPLFFVIRTFSGGIEFSLVEFFSTGIAAVLMGAFFSFCLNGYERKGYFLRWLVAIPYYIITTLLGCYFGMVLKSVWEWAANAGISLFNTFTSVITSHDKTFLQLILAFYSLVALALLIYIGVILFLFAIRDYLEIFVYGIIGILIIIVYVLLCWILGGQAFLSTQTFETIAIILVLFAMFGVDFMRVNKGELLGTDKL